MSKFRFKQFEVVQDHAAMKVGTDGCLLGALAECGNRILDVGTGTGLLALMMAQRCESAQVTGVEISHEAVIDARCNFGASPWSQRLECVESGFVEFCNERVDRVTYDSIVCNPPYFDNSLECEDEGRRCARHTSSLAFGELVKGVAELLDANGSFSVVIPAEAYGSFCGECVLNGLWLSRCYEIKTVPRKHARRMVLVFGKQQGETLITTHCLRNADNSYSSWYAELMNDFMLYIPKP